jgi:hypothetical protein
VRTRERGGVNKPLAVVSRLAERGIHVQQRLSWMESTVLTINDCVIVVVPPSTYWPHVELWMPNGKTKAYARRRTYKSLVEDIEDAKMLAKLELPHAGTTKSTASASNT